MKSHLSEEVVMENGLCESVLLHPRAIPLFAVSKRGDHICTNREGSLDFDKGLRVKRDIKMMQKQGD